MKPLTLLAPALLAFASSALAGAGDFEVKNVSVNFVQTPTFQTDLPPKAVSKPLKWMAVEVTFEAKPEFTDEMTFNYYILFATHLFVGHISHVDIARGQALHSVAYMSPKDMAGILQGRPMRDADLSNVSVTITAPGMTQVLSTKSLKPCLPAWWEAMKQEEGHVLAKSQTPFAPLWSDYYEAVKPSASR